MRQRAGWVLQLLVLMLLPMVVGWELFFGFPPIAMPACLVTAIAFFWAGNLLRKP